MKQEVAVLVALFALIGKVIILFSVYWLWFLIVYSPASATAQDVEVEGTVGDVDIDLGASREASRTGRIYLKFSILVFFHTSSCVQI